MGSARYPQSARPSRGTRPSRGAQPARRTRPSRRTRPPLPLVGALALVAIAAVALLVATACDRTPGPHIAHDGPAGPVALSAQAAQDRVGAYDHDIIELTAQGGDFSHAAQVMFEVHNPRDPKAEPLWLDAVKRGSSWTAEVDPAISGVGDYRIVAHGSDGDGDSFYAELDHTCTIAFEPADEVHLVGGDYDVAYGRRGSRSYASSKSLATGSTTTRATSTTPSGASGSSRSGTACRPRASWTARPGSPWASTPWSGTRWAPT